MDNTKAISFWQFLEKYKIEIPIIQRDYAQGRIGKEELRRSFLTNLKEALDKKLDKEKELKLDFVYGAINNNTLTPLDGQQRLTTLWLLHWYVALRAGKLEEVCEKLKKFSYETRVSSREFCEQLCNCENFKSFKPENDKIVEFITNQTWFYSAWKQDPTIQSMLRMLSRTKETDKSGNNFIDGIEELFDGVKDFTEYWERLSRENCPITFYHLPLENFGLSDDLYIKMNARGKQLTDFENLKADLIGYIQERANENKDWENLLKGEDSIPIKLDTTWTDLFWENRKEKGSKKDKGEIDDIYLTFLNRFFWNELFIAKEKNDDKYILDIGKGDETSTQENNNVSYKYLNKIDEKVGQNNNTERFYQGLDKYKYFNSKIPLDRFEKLRKVLDNFCEYYKNNEKNIYECSWNKDFSFIPKYKDDKILELNQRERIVFYAICKYFDHDTNIQDTKESFDRWMRVIWNLVSGEDNSGKPNIRSTSAMRNVIEFIEKLDSHDVYSSLLKYLKEQEIGKSEFDERCKEEFEKAEKIKADNNWEEKIIEAEKSLFFKGTIRFLFRDDKGACDWSYFDAKLENATEYFFNTEGINDIYKIELTRKLVFQCDDGNKIYDKQIFNPNASTWLWILSSKDYQKAVHNILLGKNINNPSKKILNGIEIDLNNLPYEKMIKDMPNGRFRCSWGKLGYYEPYKQTAIVYNPKLSECFKKFENIQLANEVNLGNGYFYGWDIKFKYENNEYEWKRDADFNKFEELLGINKSDVIV
jgi:hypothetical protein